MGGAAVLPRGKSLWIYGSNFYVQFANPVSGVYIPSPMEVGFILIMIYWSRLTHLRAPSVTDDMHIRVKLPA